MWDWSAVNMEYFENQLTSLFFALSWVWPARFRSRPILIQQSHQIKQFLEDNFTQRKYRNIFLHHSTAVVSHTLIQFGVNKQHCVECGILWRQLEREISHVTLMTRLNDFQTSPVLDTMLICLNRLFTHFQWPYENRFYDKNNGL